MEYVILGRTGLRVSRMGFGGMYNSQKLERTQMSLNRVIDTENVLHNGVLLSNLKQ